MERREYKCTATTKEALIESIVRLAKEKGYEKVTVRDICKQANISIGSFYHHYHSKEQLAQEAYYQIDRLITEEFIERCKKNTARENLYLILESYVRYVAEDVGLLVKDYYKIMLDETRISAFNPERLYYKALREILISCSEDGFVSKDADFTELTEYCIRFLRGLIFDWSVQNGNYNLLERFQRDFERLVNGLQ